MGSITKRPDGKYRARYRDGAGKEHAGHFARKVDAERWLTTSGADLVRGDWTDPQLGRMRFAEWVEEWEAGLVELRPTTKVLNVGVARNYLVPRFGQWQLSRIRTADVKEMLGEELTEGRLSNSAVRRHVLVLRTILDAAVADGRIGRNPAKSVKLPAEDSRPMRFLDPGEVARLADAITPHYRPLVLTAAYVGLRRGELFGLRVANVDLLRHTIKVEEQLQEVGGRLVLGPPKTKAGIRKVTMPGLLAEVLGTHFNAAPVRSSGLAFPGPKGGPARAQNFRHVWLRACVRAELGWRRAPDGSFHRDDGPLSGLTLHELRHTAAALAIAQGAHPLAIKERLGHSSITTTLDTYGGLFPSLDEALAEGLDGVLRGSLAESGPVEAEVVSITRG